MFKFQKSGISERNMHHLKRLGKSSALLLAIFLTVNGAAHVVKADDNTQTSPNQIQPYVDSTISSTWGTSPVSFDETTGILTVSGGELINNSNSLYIDTENKISKVNVKEIIFLDGVKLPSDSSAMFSNSNNTFNVTKITGNLDTSKVTNMSRMFANSKISSLDVSKWNTSKVTDMSSMFSYTQSLTNLDLSNFDTSNVTAMSYIFSNASNLTTLDISNFDTSKLTSGESNIGLFSETSKLSKIVLGPNFKFPPLSFLPQIPTSDKIYTGRWTRVEPASPKNIYNSSSEFVAGYNGTAPGTYIWEKVIYAGKNITVKYQDEDGALIQFNLLQGNIGDTYNTKAETFKGYTLKTTPENASGTFSDQAQTVIYIYTKNASPAGTGKNISVKYQDEDGLLMQSDLLQGNIGDTYNTKAETFKGYTLKTTPDNASGTFSDQAQTVTYIYAKNPDDNNQTYDVLFESNGGSIIAKQTVKSKDKLTPPNDPTRTGYVFKGWYTNKELTNSYDFNLPITQSLTLYAKWEESKPTVIDPISSSTHLSNPGASLPSTGEHNNSLLLSVGLIFITSVIGIFYWKKRKI